MPLSRYESSHQELLLSLFCVFLLLFLSLGGQNKINCLLFLSLARVFVLLFIKTTLMENNTFHSFSPKKSFYLFRSPKTHSYSFRGCVTWMLGPENPASSMVIHMWLGMVKADIS